MEAYSRGGAPVRLRETRHSGGEGRIYEIDGNAGLLAKVFHQQRRTADLHLKLLAMVSDPPKDPTLELRGHRSIAWPQELLYSDRGQQGFLGFTMPALDTRRFRESHTYFDPTDRLRRFGGAYTWKHLLISAYNIASAVAAVHNKGHRIGDLRDSNILVAPNSLITLIDCDSFQIMGRAGDVHPTRVGTGEYLPPELQSANFKSAPVDRYHSDLFALAVLIFKLLMLGAHPFQARGTAVKDLPSTEAKIGRGIYPYARSKGADPPEFAPDIRVLPPALRRLAERAFVDGHTKPERRPQATDWFEALGIEGPQLKTCKRNPNHLHSRDLRGCPWCEMATFGADPFPSPMAGSQTAAEEAAELPIRGRRIVQLTASGTTQVKAPPRDITRLKELLAQRLRQVEENEIFAIASEGVLLLLVALFALVAPVIAAAGAVLVVVPLFATAGLILHDREAGKGQLRIAVKAGPLALQSITQSLYHFIPPGLVFFAVGTGAFFTATRMAGLPTTSALQALGCIAATGWLFVVLHALDPSDVRLVIPTRRAWVAMRGAAVPTRLGKLRIVFLAPLFAIGLASLVARGVLTLWPL